MGAFSVTIKGLLCDGENNTLSVLDRVSCDEGFPVRLWWLLGAIVIGVFQFSFAVTTMVFSEKQLTCMFLRCMLICFLMLSKKKIPELTNQSYEC